LIGLAHWCSNHRRIVIVGWIIIAIAASAAAQAIGRSYSTNYGLPGTQSQTVLDLLEHDFGTQSGDKDTLVFHVTHGTIDSPSVRAAMLPLLAKVKSLPHVVGVLSPYSPGGAVEVSRDRKTAFETIFYDKPANLLNVNTGKPLIALTTTHVPGVSLAAGGAVVEDAEGFNVGPATEVGVLAALVILLITFGSLVAAGMPLVTAGLGLITGTGLIGLATHVTAISNVGPELALMIGLGVGIDYALFLVTRFRENYRRTHDVQESLDEAMDTSGRAILLAGCTVVIALLGMFATGVTFMYGLSIASVLGVLLVLLASLTLLPALISRFGTRVAGKKARAAADLSPEERALAASHSRWRSWSQFIQRHPIRMALVSLAVMIAALSPVFALRLDTSDAGNDASNLTSRHAFDMLAHGFGAGFNGPLLIVAELPSAGDAAALTTIRAAVQATPDIVHGGLSPASYSPSKRIAVFEAYPESAPQAPATTNLVNTLRNTVLPRFTQTAHATVLVGGFTAGSIDFSNVLSAKLPLFIAIVVVLSALLLLVMFRSPVIALQAAAMNILSIGGSLGATVAIFQWGWLSSIFGVQKGPIEPWIPVIIFAVVFGLSMDYEVFLVSRVREEWIRRQDATEAVTNGLAFTGRVITAAAAIMICVFLSFMLGDERSIKEFGFGLAAAVFLDAVVVRCVLLPAVLELLGPVTWRLPSWLDARLPHINIEGNAARGAAAARAPAHRPLEPETEPA
jgi:RND superfamily putative drug exporter